MEAAVKHPMKTRDVAYIGMFAALMAICSWISIPTTVPFTLQTMGVFTAVGLLGGKRGTTAVLVYILMGAIGLPVFSGFTGGMGILFGSTGGTTTEENAKDDGKESRSGETKTTMDYIRDAQKAYNAAQDALKDGNWSEYGKQMDALEEALNSVKK